MPRSGQCPRSSAAGSPPPRSCPISSRRSCITSMPIAGRADIGFNTVPRAVRERIGGWARSAHVSRRAMSKAGSAWTVANNSGQLEHEQNRRRVGVLFDAPERPGLLVFSRRPFSKKRDLPRFNAICVQKCGLLHQFTQHFDDAEGQSCHNLDQVGGLSPPRLSRNKRTAGPFQSLRRELHVWGPAKFPARAGYNREE